MEPQDLERRLAAIMSADVQGYARLMGQDEVATVRTITAYREVVAELIGRFRGRVVDMPGDNILAEFASAIAAVECSARIQSELKARNQELPKDRRMHFRIGINVGDVIIDGERIYGDGVNIAARLESLAPGGGICISGTVFDQIETKLDLDYASLGRRQVKNISQPVRVYQVLLPGDKAPGPEKKEPGEAGAEEAGHDRSRQRRETHSALKETLSYFTEQVKDRLSGTQPREHRPSWTGQGWRDRTPGDRSGQSVEDLLTEANRLIRQTDKKANRQARWHYEQALKLDPDSAEAMTGLGWTYFVEWPYGWSRSEEPLDKAGEMAREALRLKPNLFLARLLQAWVHLWQRDYVLALAKVTKLLDQEPENADALAFMAYALAMSGLSAKAGGLVDRALSHRPRHPLFHSFYLGVVYFHLGRYEEAEAALDRALKRRPNFLTARVVRAMVLAEQGRKEEARNETKAIKSLAPDYNLKTALQRYPHKDPAVVERCRKSLRRAGLK